MLRRHRHERCRAGGMLERTVMLAFVCLIACDAPVASPGGDGGLLDGAAGSCSGMSDGARCSAGICLHGSCVASVCGDGFLDMARGEDCDDGNTISQDGCDPPSCTFSCV